MDFIEPSIKRRVNQWLRIPFAGAQDQKWIGADQGGGAVRVADISIGPIQVRFQDTIDEKPDIAIRPSALDGQMMPPAISDCRTAA
jgi:hypothetical protein